MAAKYKKLEDSQKHIDTLKHTCGAVQVLALEPPIQERIVSLNGVQTVWTLLKHPDPEVRGAAGEALAVRLSIFAFACHFFMKNYNFFVVVCCWP